jgi:hypothetical protein
MILMLLHMNFAEVFDHLGSLLMSWHLRDAGVLTACLLLLLDLLVVQSLLLLFGHVAPRASHTRLCLWHGGNIVG